MSNVDGPYFYLYFRMMMEIEYLFIFLIQVTMQVQTPLEPDLDGDGDSKGLIEKKAYEGEPLVLWQKFQIDLSQDFMPQSCDNMDIAHSHALESIAGALEEHGKVLDNFGLPQPAHNLSELLHKQIKWDSEAHELAADVNEAYAVMTSNQ
ncbi:hypothetical protein F5141DRAFT_1219454 [Pisolithus sp. B1]|nr:hypothetical protein F5141DRAFT_1219454 [Pisolithus sp. B1]